MCVRVVVSSAPSLPTWIHPVTWLQPKNQQLLLRTPITEPLILDCLSSSQIDATKTPQLLYLDDSKHFWQGILRGGHRRQEAEEMVSRGIRKHLEVVGRVLWSTNTVSEDHSSSRPSSSSYSRIMTGELPSPKPNEVLKPRKAHASISAGQPDTLHKDFSGTSLLCSLSPHHERRGCRAGAENCLVSTRYLTAGK